MTAFMYFFALLVGTPVLVLGPLLLAVVVEDNKVKKTTKK